MRHPTRNPIAILSLTLLAACASLGTPEDSAGTYRCFLENADPMIPAIPPRVTKIDDDTIGVASWFTDQAVVPLRKEGNSYRASVQEVTAAIGQPPLPLGETAFAWTRGSGGKYIMTGKRPRDTEASFKAVCHKE